MLVAIAALLLSGLHPDSHSFSVVRVDGPRVAVELHVQSRSLIEALGHDVDLDGRFDAGELDAARASLATYLLDRYRLRIGSDGEPGEGERLEGRLTSLATRWRADMLLPEEWLRAELVFEAAGAPDEILIEVSLFAEENPFHRDTCVLEWNGEEPASWLFGIDGPSWWFEPAARRRPRVFASYVRLGFRHILSGWDQLAFLLALLVAARSLRSLAGLVTAFAVAHSATLALAAFDVVSMPARLIELTIAMSVAYVAAENLLFRKPSGRWPEAFVFGLVHGLGLAGYLAEPLRFEGLRTTALLGFNLGLELGLVGIVILAAGLLRFLPGDRSHGDRARAWLAPRRVRVGASALALVFGSWWFVERAGWIG